jgi:hypothetical protein
VVVTGSSSAFTTDIVFHVANATVADLTKFAADLGNPQTRASSHSRGWPVYF